MSNLVNAERISKSYGTRTLLDDVSLGLSKGDVIGVVGRNGDGKTTLLGILTGRVEPDSGRVVTAGNASIGLLTQGDDFPDAATVRDIIVNGAADHVWAANSLTRSIVAHLLADIDLDSPISQLSGGERRRTALVRLMLAGHDLLVLDEPTNHLDVEAVSWLAAHLKALQNGNTAMLVVSHDRWFLDEICTRIWEVHDATVDTYDGGYSAYVLARTERTRQTAATEARRQNLLRKELAWLRRGAPARTSKPKFRIEAANELIANEPPPRDSVVLRRFAVTRLGKDVFDLHRVTVQLPDGRTLLNKVDWSIGPGDRIGIIGVNGSGKSTLLRLLAHEAEPTSGKVKQGKTLRLGHLTQTVGELDDNDRVLDSMNRLKLQTVLATGREASASSLLEDFGFTGDRLVTRIGDLSGGERRRLQFLRLLLTEPNVLLLDEPTNDLDIDTLTAIEDYLDTWPGTLVVVSHDRFFLERVCDVIYALLEDGSCVLLPGGVDQYVRHRDETLAGRTPVPRQQQAAATRDATGGERAVTAAAQRQARKDVQRIEQQLAKLATKLEELRQQMADNASDYEKLAELQHSLTRLAHTRDELELAWFQAAELAQ